MPAPKLPCIDYKALTAGKDKDFDLDAKKIRPIWEYAKKRYLENGVSLEDTINALARETGAPPRLFQEVIVGRKSGPRIKTKEIFAKEDARRMAILKTQQMIDRADKSPVWRFIRAVGEIPRASLVALHGGVFPVTHGGALLLNPWEWRTFWRGAKVSWATFDLPGGTRGKAYYEQARLDLQNAHNYAEWRSAGLRIGVEERPSGILNEWITKSPNWSSRSWLGLSRMRYEFAEQSLKNFKWKTDAERQDIMKHLAEVANHATGVTNVGLGRWLGQSKLFFAPQLTASKILRASRDPLITVGTAVKMMSGGKVSAGERAAMMVRLGHASAMLGTWAAGLILNDIVMRAFGSSQKINWDDPRKSDWLRFKTGKGDIISTRGPEEVLRLYGQLAAIAHANKRQLHGHSALDEAMDSIQQFIEYKLSPGVTTAVELGYGTDIFGRPLPKGIQELRHAASLTGLHQASPRTGKPYYSGWEYTATHIPIFLSGPARDIYDRMRAQGLSQPKADMILHAAILTAAEFAGFGSHYERPAHIAPAKRGKTQFHGTVTGN
jgi:hypothetical protein